MRAATRRRLSDEKARHAFNWARFRATADGCAEAGKLLERGITRQSARINESADRGTVLAFVAQAEQAIAAQDAMLADLTRIVAWQAGYIAQREDMDRLGLRLPLDSEDI